ncbi:MAG: NAD(P)/FAD-dependent oxidoreductase [Candidatus Thorarchaeota archaeon]
MELAKLNFDVIVVGAATSGAIAARFAAQLGLKVCLIDSNTRSEIGNKICGDVILATIFDFLNINPPKEDELLSRKRGFRLYSPDQKSSLTIKLPIYLVDRLRFGQRLLNEAIDSGIEEFLDRSRVVSLTYNKEGVDGVRVRLKDGSKVDLKSKIIIDASGCYSTLRRTIKSTLIMNEIPKRDLILCFRGIVKLPSESRPIQDVDFCTLIVDPDKRSPGGFIWYFPKNESIINIGLGTFIQYKGSIKEYFQKYVFDYFVTQTKFDIISSAGCVVPLRRPLPSCADSGIMFVGDAGCHVNPANGGGIDVGMKSGYYAAQVAKKAIHANDYSLDTLWEYNSIIMSDFGAKHAVSDIIKLFFQYKPSEDLNFIIKKRILTDIDISKLWLQGFLNLNFKANIKKAIKGITRPRLLFELKNLIKYMNRVNNLYKSYPNSVNSFEKWRVQEKSLFEKINLKFT